MPVSPEAQCPRQRRHHTRSRNGCQTCRQRRVRCGEEQPICKNCKIGNRNCTYIAPAIPLRDRRLQESESHKPWQSMAAVIQLPVPSSTLPDPFRCLPIDMPLKSNELFQYVLHSTENTVQTYNNVETKDFIIRSVKEPLRFRSLFLLAGVSFACIRGGLHDYQVTQLHHLAEGIRGLNKALFSNEIDSRTRALCIELIAVLAINETFLGNISAAQSHVNGLVALFTNCLDLEEEKKAGKKDEEAQLVNRMHLLRMALLAHQFLTKVRALQSDDIKQLEDKIPVRLVAHSRSSSDLTRSSNHMNQWCPQSPEMILLFLTIAEEFKGKSDLDFYKIMGTVQRVAASRK